jgi:FdrA protein
MSMTQYEIRPGAYYDSVVLMHLQRALLNEPGILDAGVVMSTPANQELLAQNDLLPEEAKVSKPEDLLIVLRSESAKSAQDALTRIDELIASRRSVSAGKFHPKSLASAVKFLPAAKYALISVPGRFAAGVAHEALDLDLHVFLYSDNVRMEDEIQLKEQSKSKGLLVMGPDCGTALIHGIGFGFANRVRPGTIGLVGAAGTGLQAISSHIHQLGSGVSHALGTGGRDLKAAVGGVTAIQALTFLDRDPSTEVIVIVSKPPDPEVAARLLSAAENSSKPVVIQFMGYAPPSNRMGNLHFAVNFREAAAVAVRVLESVVPRPEPKRGSPLTNERKYIRGLFSGGSLGNEMLRALLVRHAPVYSNISEIAAYQLDDPLKPIQHTLLDLGEDIFTVGRLHPMIDNDLRMRMIRQEAADPEVGMILLDVVLGEGAHPDPAGDLAGPISEAIREGVEVVVVLVGTGEDPQDLDAQREKLLNSGAHVFEDAQSAMQFIGDRVPRSEPQGDPPSSIIPLPSPVAAINVGLESCFESLIEQGAQSVHVDWRPPAGGNEKLMSILKKMRE